MTICMRSDWLRFSDCLSLYFLVILTGLDYGLSEKFYSDVFLQMFFKQKLHLKFSNFHCCHSYLKLHGCLIVTGLLQYVCSVQKREAHPLSFAWCPKMPYCIIKRCPFGHNTGKYQTSVFHVRASACRYFPMTVLGNNITKL